MGTLFLVATPIGNLGDISRRALDILNDVDLIACEDTRHTIKLLNHFGIEKPLTSYHDFNEEQKANQFAEKLAGNTKIALVSDAGMPAISDPGYRIVRLCRERGIPVVVIPGPNAAVAARTFERTAYDVVASVDSEAGGFIPRVRSGYDPRRVATFELAPFQ